MFSSASKRLISSLSLFAALGLTACNAPDASLGQVLGTDQTTGSPQPIPTDAPPSGKNGGADTPRIGPTCHSEDPSQICLSLKYVVYADSSGAPLFSEEQAVTNLAQINQVWSQCGIAFEIGEFDSPTPSDYGLSLNTPTLGELTSIRNAFEDDTHLLVVTTGTWSGSLGAGAANAWTAMPGGGPYGVVLEKPVGDYPNIIAHELGHYLNLDHVSDTSDVMNAVIYTSSTKLTTSQCNTARSAASAFWSEMER
jgi:hypothetical protein